MANTYVVRVTNQDDVVFNGEVPTYQLFSFPTTYTTFIPKAYAWLALFNAVNSGYIVKIKSIGVERVQIYNSLVLNNCLVSRCSSTSGGADFAVAKLDSASSALPSQVLIKDKPTVTLTASTSILNFRHLIQSTFYNISSSVNFPGRRFGERFTACLWDELVSSGYGNADTQGWILNEGQGIAITRDANVYPNDLRVEIRVMFNVGSSSYIASRIVGIDQRTIGTECIASIFNGSGSGVVLDVKQISMTEVGAIETAHFSVEPIVEIEDGTSLTPTKMDSASPDLPAGIAVNFKPIVVIRSPTDGVLIASPALCRFNVNSHGIGAGDSTMALVQGAFNDEVFSGDYVVEPGSGLAIIQRSASVWGVCDFKFVFTVEASATTGGAGTKSRYAKPGHSGLGFR